MSVMASQLTSPTIVYLTVYSRRRSKKHQSSTSLAFVRGIHRHPQSASNAEHVSIWWRHHATSLIVYCVLITVESTRRCRWPSTRLSPVRQKQPRITLGIANMHQGADSIIRCHFTSIGNPVVKIRRYYDRCISSMGFPILERWHLYIESRPSKPIMAPSRRQDINNNHTDSKMSTMQRLIARAANVYCL